MIPDGITKKTLKSINKVTLEFKVPDYKPWNDKKEHTRY